MKIMKKNYYLKSLLLLATIILGKTSFSQCVELACPSNVIVNNDPGECGAVVTFSAPVGVDPCDPITATFNFTGNAQTWVVPAGVTSINIEVYGAQGGDSETCSGPLNIDGGLGGFASGTLSVTPGETLTIYVGGKPLNGDLGGGNDLGGFNGGGNGGMYAGAGGGASDVRQGGTSFSDRVIVAGGGGGGNTGCPDHGIGGAGGGLVGGDGIQLSWAFAAGGGTQTEGGAPGEQGIQGALGLGGHQGLSEYHVAGGGGGYYGGGSSYAAGAGGGSSYLGGVTSGTTTAGIQTGDGLVVISYANQVPLTVTQTAGIPSGEVFPVGITTQSFLGDDGLGNTYTCSFTIEVIDNENPTITAPANLNINTDETSCDAANVSLGTPVTNDNCEVDAVSNDAPATFPIGTTIVTWTVLDAAGNSSTTTQEVTVTDEVAPAISNCPANITVTASEANCSANASWGAPVAVDNCSATVTETASHNSGDLFDFGTTLVTYEFEDANGNVGTCSFNVEVITDLNAAPSATDIIQGNDGSVTVVVTGGEAPYSFEWEGPNSFTSNDQDLSNLNSPGTYTVTITDENGCEIEVSVLVNSQVGLVENNLNSIVVFPNPNNGEFKLLFGNVQSTIAIAIVDLQGRIIYNNTASNTDSVNVTMNAAAGIYNVIIEADGMQYVQKITLK
jgi:large repetitive protein